MGGEPHDPVPAAQFEELVTTYRKLLRDTILKVCPRDLGLHVDDIEQEVRIRLWRAIRNETDIRDRASYIYKVAFTATIDAIRRVKARREEPFDPADDDLPAGALALPASGTPEQIAGRRELFARVAAELAHLAPDRRRAAGLHLEGLTLHEIAALLHWSESRTRNLVYRGLSDLRARLRAGGIDYEIV